MKIHNIGKFLEKANVQDDIFPKMTRVELGKIVSPLADNLRPEDVILYVEDEIVVVSDSHGDCYAMNPETWQMERWYMAACTGNSGFWEDLSGHQCNDACCDFFREKTERKDK